jgi:creatinine amidohydrolase/Fe(II)-dependent formamide hydrolase-like protein
MRPDLQDPSLVYGALGSINAILATLQHIVGEVSRSAARARSTDDGRCVIDASAAVAEHGRAAIEALAHAYREVSTAHSVVSHFIFPVDEDDDE